MKKPLMMLTCALSLTACTTNPKVAAMAQPATVIHVKSTAKVISKLSELCDRAGLRIDESNANNVTCSQESGVLAQALFGTKYGTAVRTTVRFNAFPVDHGIRVVANSSMGNQTAFGQNNTTDLGNGGVMSQQMQTILDEAKKELEGK